MSDWTDMDDATGVVSMRVLMQRDRQIDNLKATVVQLHQRIVEKDAAIVRLTVERNQARRERDQLGDALVDKMVEGPAGGPEVPSNQGWDADQDAMDRKDAAFEARLAEQEVTDDGYFLYDTQSDEQN